MSNIDIFRNGISGSSSIGTRLSNVKNEDITSNKLIIFKNNNEIESTSISSTGQQILNSVSLPELKTLLLNGVQEAVVFSNNTEREINFHIKSADADPIDSSNLRLSIQEDELRIYDDIIPQVGNRDLGSDTNQFGSFYGSNIKIGRIYSKEPNATIYLDMTLDTKLLTYKHFEAQTTDLNIGSTTNPFNNIYLSNTIIADGNTPINFNAQKYIFYTQGNLNKKLEITNASCDFNSCNLRILGNNNNLTLCSNNGTQHLQVQYLTSGGARTNIHSLTTPLHITTGSNQNIEITPNGTGNILLNRPVYCSNINTQGLRVYDTGSYIDLRSVDYTTQGEHTDTSPIYFNTGFYSPGSDLTHIRKSMIFGGIGNTLPPNENSSYGRNNIIFCVENTETHTLVDTDDEKFRVGQLANYTSVDILPRNTTCDLGADTLPTGAGTENWFRNGFFSSVYAGNILLTSDITLKQNITDLEYGLEYILQLKPKKYQYINNKNGREHFGFLAQDIRELNQNDKLSIWGLRPNGKQQLNYTEFIGPIVKSLQELNEKIKQPIFNIDGQELDLSPIYKRLDKIENELINKEKPPIEDKDDALINFQTPINIRINERLDIIEEKLNNKDTSDDESDGHFNIIEDLQAKNFQLEQRLSKLEKQNKKLTTALNKILKNGVN